MRNAFSQETGKLIVSSDLATFLFPTPSEIKYQDGTFKIPTELSFYSQDDLLKDLLPISPLLLNLSNEPSAPIHLVRQDFGHEEAFSIVCSPEKITMFTPGAKAALFALHVLKQIFESSEETIPCFEINDRPALRRRAFMLDVSRCKVPTMDSVYELIDLLSILRFNEIQLYIEHTFAFQNHATVWDQFSPFTGEEIRQIDNYCKQRFIELVPNLNSFGHFERWLRHERYKKMAECPDGFHRDEPFMVRDHGSVLKPNQESLEFIDSLYEEYLPHFSSSKFNVGLDEPWELGQGWSQTMVESKGKHTVYLDHLKGILGLVEKRGKSMEFWADVLLEKPENAQNLPSSASPVIWGYEADHPFEEQAKTLASCGLKYSLAPGTATWRSFSGRWDTVRQNLSAACDIAGKYQAEGVVLTTWGDCGNHQPWATLYPPLFLGAQLAWNGRDMSDDQIGSAVDHFVFHSPAIGLGKELINLAKLDQITGFNLPNNSLPWFALFSAQPEKLPEHLAMQTNIAKMKKGLEWLEELDGKRLPFEKDSPGNHAEMERRLGIQLSRIGLQHAFSLLQPSTQFPRTDQMDQELVQEFQDIWSLRARRGGLHEAVDLLEKALQKTNRA